MEKIKIEAGTVQETLLIPLYGRHKRYGFITNLVFRHLDRSGMCQVIEMDFAR